MIQIYKTAVYPVVILYGYEAWSLALMIEGI
jgi:hypothetical protein